MNANDFVGGIQPGVRYIYRVTAIGPNGEVGWNTIHWTPPCRGSVSVNRTVDGSTVVLSGRWSSCPTSSTVRILDAYTFVISTSYGYVTTKYAIDRNQYYATIYGVPVGQHTFTVMATWYNGGTSNPGSVPVAVSY